jgi:hypothetical protein
VTLEARSFRLKRETLVPAHRRALETPIAHLLEQQA